MRIEGKTYESKGKEIDQQPPVIYRERQIAIYYFIYFNAYVEAKLY